MTEEKLDTWRDRMIAALYGELTAEEQRELELAMESDESLRRDWQELNEVRSWLAEAGGQDQESGSVFEMPSAAAPAPRIAEVVPLRRWFPPAAAGFAAAATVFLGLLLFGLRVDRTPAGVLVGFGTASTEETAVAAQAGPVAEVAATSPGQDYLTRAEFAFMTQELYDVTAARLGEMERRQNGAQAELTQALYGALADRQQRHYDDLKTYIDLAAYRTVQAVPHMAAVPGRFPNTPMMEDTENDTY